MSKKGSMVRTNWAVSPQQFDYLKRIASDQGLRVAEVMRRIIDEYRQAHPLEKTT